MARPTVRKQLALPAGGSAARVKAYLRLVASLDGGGYGYVVGSSIDVADTYQATADATGLLQFTGVHPNSGNSSDVITTPAGTVYELTVQFHDGRRRVEYISVPDVTGPLWVHDCLTLPPTDLEVPGALTPSQLTALKNIPNGIAGLGSGGWLERTYRPDLDVFNVKDAPFNAVGNGVADDTAAINAAIAAASVAGGVVYLPAGAYKLTGRLTIQADNVQIRGIGPASELQMRAAAIAVYARNCQNLVLADFGAEAADLYGQLNAGLVQINNVKGFSVERLHVHNTVGRVNAIAVSGAAEVPDGSGQSMGRVVGCHLHHIGKTPLYASTGARGCEFDGNYIHDLPVNVVASPGIQVLGGQGTRVTNNFIERAQAGGILVQAGGNWPTYEDVPWDTYVAGNWVRDPIAGGAGISVNASLFPTDGAAQNGRVIVTDNDIRGCDNGILVKDITNVVVTDNIVHENRTSGGSGSGITLDTVRDVIVTGNLGFNNGRDGLVIQDSNHLTVIANRFMIDADSGSAAQDRGLELIGVNSDLIIAFNYFQGTITGISGSGLVGSNLTAYGNTPSTIDVSATLSLTQRMQIGTNPAQSGGIGVDNNVYYAARNAAGTGDVSLFRLNASDQLQFLPAGGVINLAGSGGINVALDTGTGTKWGTSAANKQAWWGATPLVQPTTAVAGGTFVANTGTAINDASTIDGYTLKQVVRALRLAGLLA